MNFGEKRLDRAGFIGISFSIRVHSGCGFGGWRRGRIGLYQVFY
jgi:hypothetical protein